MMNEDRLETHRRVVKAIFDRGWNQADFDGIDALIADDARFHIGQQTLPTSAEDLKRSVSGWHRAFPDFRLTIEDMIAEGDLVALRLRLSGTHRGRWQDVPASGKRMSVTAMMFLRFEHGQVVEIWEDYDEHDLRKQLSEG